MTEEKLVSILDEVIERKFEILSNQIKKELQIDRKLSVEAAAEQCDVIPLTIRNWIKKGILKGSKIGHRVFIMQSDLDEALREVKSLKYKR